MKRVGEILGFVVAFALVLGAARDSNAYRPKFPEGPYYFSSKNDRFVVEVVPRVRLVAEHRVLVRKAQTVGLYRRGEGRTWEEVSTFAVPRLPLIREVLVSNDGERIVIRIDENPMARNTNRNDGIFVYSRAGKRLGAHSHFSIFGSPGNFRNVEIGIDNKKSELVFVEDEQEARRPL